MFFHIEERRIWVRSHTHTAVSDRDPAFARFAGDPSGRIKRLLRVWLAERRGAQRYLRAYLGCVTLCTAGPSYRDLRRLFCLTGRAARAAGQSARASRRHLVRVLRAYARQPCLPR